jgi:hypothetical protein
MGLDRRSVETVVMVLSRRTSCRPWKIRELPKYVKTAACPGNAGGGAFVLSGLEERLEPVFAGLRSHPCVLSEAAPWRSSRPTAARH